MSVRMEIQPVCKTGHASMMEPVPITEPAAAWGPVRNTAYASIRKTVQTAGHQGRTAQAIKTAVIMAVAVEADTAGAKAMETCVYDGSESDCRQVITGAAHER